MWLSVSVDTQQWALSSSIDIESSTLVYGPLSVSPGQWFNLTLDVAGRYVSAAVNGVPARDVM